jgi:hypothetical protein
MARILASTTVSVSDLALACHWPASCRSATETTAGSCAVDEDAKINHATSYGHAALGHRRHTCHGCVRERLLLRVLHYATRTRPN